MLSFPLNNKVVFMQGAIGGIGLEIAKYFAQSGAHILFVSENGEEIDKASRIIKAQGGSVEPCFISTFNRKNWNYMLARIANQYEKIDVLLNLFSVQAILNKINGSGTAQKLQKSLNIIFSCYFYRSRRVAELMGSGNVINISAFPDKKSTRNLRISAELAEYLDVFTQFLAIELSRTRIQVNGIVPGDEAGVLKEIPRMAGYRFAELPMIKPGELEQLVLHIASNNFDCLSGEVIDYQGKHSSPAYC